MTLKDRILNCSDLKEAEVTVEQWSTPDDPCVVLVRGMTARGRSSFLQAVKAKTDDEAAVEAIIDCAMDPKTRERIFEPAHREELLGKSAKAIETLFGKIAELSGVGPGAQQALEKN